MRFTSLVLSSAVGVLIASNVVDGQEWVPYEGEMPANAFMPTPDNPNAGAICRMTGPSDVSQRHLVGSVEEEEGELVCRGVTYSAGKHTLESDRRIVADPHFDVLVFAAAPAAVRQATAGMVAKAEVDAAGECPWGTHYAGHLFCEGSVQWENLKPKVGVEEIWQGLLCVKALQDCGERGGNGSVVCRRWDAQ